LEILANFQQRPRHAPKADNRVPQPPSPFFIFGRKDSSGQMSDWAKSRYLAGDSADISVVIHMKEAARGVGSRANDSADVDHRSTRLSSPITSAISIPRVLGVCRNKS
jgi:hypothetical protein